MVARHIFVKLAALALAALVSVSLLSLPGVAPVAAHTLKLGYTDAL